MEVQAGLALYWRQRLNTFGSSTLRVNNIVFICLGRQTKHKMVAKCQTLMLFIANAESSPLF
jgi:hypothetical protein